MEYRDDRLAIDSLHKSGTPIQINDWLKNYFIPSYSIKYERGNVDVEIPINLLTTHIPWKGKDSDNTTLYLASSLSWKHMFSPFLRLNLHGSIDKSPTAEFISGESYYNSYRSRLLMQDKIGWTRSSSMAFSLYYANLINMVTWSLTGTASWRTLDHYNEYSHGTQLTEIRPVWENVRSRMFYGSFTVDKTFTKIDLLVRGSVDGSRNEMPIAQNDMRQTVKSNVLSTNLFIRWDKSSWLILSNNLTFNVAWQDKFEGGNSYALKSFFHITNLLFFLFIG